MVVIVSVAVAMLYDLMPRLVRVDSSIALGIVMVKVCVRMRCDAKARILDDDPRCKAHSLYTHLL